MLAIGVVVGAAIGPAPTPSFAVNRLLPLLPSFLHAATKPSTPAAQPPAITPEATPFAQAQTRRRHRLRRGAEVASSSSAETPTSTEAAPSAATRPATKTKTVALPPVTKVWLIELSGSSFGEVAVQPSAAPYISTQALPTGTLLSGWSELDASAFAGSAALISSTPPQVLDTIVQPPCPASSPQGEAAGGAACAPDTPGALTTADEFLKATLPTITSSAAYRENGLVVVTFASIAAATATGLPAGATTATLTSTPPAGALLISPFVAAGAKSSAALDTTSPKQSLEKLLRR